MHALPLVSADLRGLATLILAPAPGTTSWPIATESAGDVGRQVLELIQAIPSPDPLAIKLMERHPFSTQTFLALDSGRWLIVLAPSDLSGEPDLGNCFSLVAKGGEAICIHRNVWHAPLTPIDRPSIFAMTMWRRASGGDGEVRTLGGPLRVHLQD